MVDRKTRMPHLNSLLYCLNGNSKTSCKPKKENINKVSNSLLLGVVAVARDSGAVGKEHRRDSQDRIFEFLGD